MQTARTTVSSDAARFLKQCHAALRQHTGGNPRPFLELWSRAPDVSLMGVPVAIRSASTQSARY